MQRGFGATALSSEVGLAVDAKVDKTREIRIASIRPLTFDF
jgi:hypothetical protein